MNKLDTQFKKLYNYYEYYTKKNTKYVVLSEDDFYKNIIDHKILIISENQEVNGFLSCVIQYEKAYITLNYGTLETKQNQLVKLEKVLKNSNVKSIWNHFFNPVKLPFHPIKGIVHPAHQGVEYKSEDYDMYMNNGYDDNSLQQTYYLNLDTYHSDFQKYPSDDITIEFYDENIHYGLTEFTDEINNKGFKSSIIKNNDSEESKPLLVALDRNKVIGFTGPLNVQADLRGSFAGIGILKNYEGRKIGTYLFNNLCQKLKDMGAKYITLFTGESNKARFIYQRAGFVIVSSQMTLKKKLDVINNEL